MTEATATRFQELRTHWRMLLVATLVSGCGTNTAYYTAGLFYRPVSAEFGVAQSAVAACAVVGTAVGLLLAFPFGRLVDRYGVRRIAIGGFLAYSLSLAGLGLYRGPFIGFAALSVVMSVVGMAAGPIIVTRVVSGHFSRARGLTLGIATAGPGLAGLFTLPLIQLAITNGGYRPGYLGLAAMTLAVLPLAATLRQDATRPGEPVGELPGLEPRSALRTRTFAVMITAFTAAAIGIAALIVHMAPLLQHAGLAPGAAASVASLAGIGGLIGRLGAGSLIDMFFPTRIAVILFIAASAGTLLLLGPLALAPIAVLLIGIAAGAESDIVAYLVGYYFGLRAYATVFAIGSSIFTLGIALGPFTLAALVDHTGTYTYGVIATAVLLLIGALGIALLPRERQWQSEPASFQQSA